MKKDNYFWAILLILAGGLLLLSNLGILTINVWGILWPMFLILSGVWFLLGSQFGYSTAEVEDAVIPLEGASRARVHIQHGAGRLHLDDSAKAGELLSGTFGGGLNRLIKQDGDVLDVKLKPVRHHTVPFFSVGPGSGLNWTFGLSPEIPLELEFETGAGEMRLDLTSLRVVDLHLQTGASSTTVDMPAAAGQTHAHIEAGAAAVTINIPPEVAARIHTSSGLAAISINQDRFPRQGKIYQSPDYDTASNKLDLEIETGVSSVNIH